MNEPFYNCHIHTFIEYDIPDKFLPLRLVRVLARQRNYEWLASILHSLNPFSSKDLFDRYLSFVDTGRLGSQEAVFEQCLSQYPSDTGFIVLPMDMAYMGCGNVPRDYSLQLIELKNLRDKYPSIIPFIHVDPRRTEFFSLFMQAVNQWKFKGVKLYPPIGVFPYDKRLYSVYDYCEKNNIPVLAHCTAGNPVYFKGKKKELIRLLDDCKLKIDWNKSNKDLCAYFTHPEGYKYVLEDFPNLKICLAHFGRETEWDIIILKMMDKFPNLYADCSYTMSDSDHWPMMKVRLETNPQFRKRLLFGSDFYMSEVECTEKQFSINFRAYIGESLWHQIAVENPKNYLKIINT